MELGPEDVSPIRGVLMYRFQWSEYDNVLKIFHFGDLCVNFIYASW